VLAGPPPGGFTLRHAVYAPGTYKILCLPGQPAPPEVSERLWGLGLLEAIL